MAEHTEADVALVANALNERWAAASNVVPTGTSRQVWDHYARAALDALAAAGRLRPDARCTHDEHAYVLSAVVDGQQTMVCDWCGNVVPRLDST